MLFVNEQLYICYENANHLDCKLFADEIKQKGKIL